MVVVLVRRIEAGDVLALQLEVPLQAGEELRKVGLGPRALPDRLAERSGTGQLGAKLGRDAAELLVVATGDPDEARLERVVLKRLLELRQVLEQQSNFVR